MCEVWDDVQGLSGIGLQENFCTNINSNWYWCYVKSEGQLVAQSCSKACDGNFFSITYYTVIEVKTSKVQFLHKIIDVIELIF